MNDKMVSSTLKILMADMNSTGIPDYYEGWAKGYLLAVRQAGLINDDERTQAEERVVMAAIRRRVEISCRQSPSKMRAGGESGKRFGGGLVPGRLENESGAQRGD